jgi:hypothetical protein
VLAAAQVDGLGLGGFEFEGGEVRAGVRAVAEGLIGTLATGTPVIALAGLDGGGDRGFLRDDGFRHE